jgi:biotin carboxyl carrier protein
VVVDGWRFEVSAEDARQAELRERALRAAAEHGVAARLVVRAQIPGRVTRLWVRAGEPVEAGQRMLAIEAMKMENEIRAPRAGTVEAVAVAEGQRVELNDELLALA